MCYQQSGLELQKVASGASQTGFKQSSSAALSAGQRAPVAGDDVTGSRAASQQSKVSAAGTGSVKPLGHSS